jgi:hypothetical protein
MGKNPKSKKIPFFSGIYSFDPGEDNEQGKLNP